MHPVIATHLSADPYLATDARAIANTSYWHDLAGNADAIWGNFRTSRTNYNTQIDWRYEKPAFRCNCRSRKHPCKHILGLALLFFNHNDRFRLTEDFPEEAQQWLDRRAARRMPKTRSSQQEAALQAIRKKNWDKRLTQMSSGLAELERWLHDSLREGLAHLHEQPATYWEEWSASLVNAKLGSLAKRIKAIPALFVQKDWHEALLEELGSIYLLIKGFRQIEDLPLGLQQELFNTIGVNIKKDEVLQTEGVQDTWLVLGQQEGLEEKLVFQRTWLLGQKTGRYALLLDFAWGRQGFPHEWEVGTCLEGQLAFYPGTYPQRALFQQFTQQVAALPNVGYSDLSAFQKAYTHALAANPWLSHFPAYIEDVVPVLEEEKLYLADLNGLQLPCQILLPQTTWQLIALSSGQPIHVFGTWNKRVFLPLSAVAEGRFIAFTIKHQRKQPQPRWRS